MFATWVARNVADVSRSSTTNTNGVPGGSGRGDPSRFGARAQVLGGHEGLLIALGIDRGDANSATRTPVADDA